MSYNMVPQIVAAGFPAKQSFSAFVDSYYVQLGSKADGPRPSAKSHLIISQSLDTDQDVHHMPISDVDDQSESGSCADVRVLLSDPICCMDYQPFVLVEKLSDEVYQRYMVKRDDERYARHMAKDPERRSKRKRAAESPQPIANSVAVCGKKRFKCSASPGRKSLATVTNVPRPKKRMFEMIPDGVVVPNIFKRLMHPVVFDELVDCEVTESEVTCESPFTSVEFLQNLTFDDLCEIAECSILNHVDAASHLIRGEMISKMRDIVTDSSEPVPCPTAACSSLPLPTTAILSSESCEPCLSPPQVPADDSPDVTAQTPGESSVRSSHHSVRETVIAPVFSPHSVDQETAPAVKNRDNLTNESSLSSSPSAATPSDRSPVRTDTKKSKKRDPDAGSGEGKRPCPHCFMSKLLLTDSVMQTHIRFAHPDLRQ